MYSTRQGRPPEVFDDDKQDNDSGIQKDEKDVEGEEEEKKENENVNKKKPKLKVRSQSPQKLQQRNRDGSPKKNLGSPKKSPKKRKKKLRPEKQSPPPQLLYNFSDELMQKDGVGFEVN